MSSNLEQSLNERPTSWLAFDQCRYLLLAGPIGGREVFFHTNGALYAYAPLSDWAVKAALDGAGLQAEMAEVTMRAENTVELAGDDAARMQKLLDVLEDLDDVQEVYHNAELN